MIEIMIEKKNPKMMAMKFLEECGNMDYSKMDEAKANELQKIVKEVKMNMDKPEMLLPLVMKGKEIMASVEKPKMEMEDEEDMSEDTSEDMPEPKQEYKAMDALNEIKAILAKVKED